ncbi:hypothetical protein ACS0TY_029364 [Phlomoides rotata]
MEKIDDKIERELWGDKDCEWVYREAVGRSGGLISIWNTKVFVKTSSWHLGGMLDENVDMVIITVYAPCSIPEKEQLWEAINIVVEQYNDRKLCVVGDFNSIREVNERVGRREEVNHRDINLFEDFISLSGLIELPLRGRRYTWYRPDGTCKSKLDRMLANVDWLSWRPDLKLKGLGRSVSDHCPLILVHSITDWAPKPFNFFNGWLVHPDFRNLCISELDKYNISGWKSYSLSIKLKRLKLVLKQWSRNTFSSLNNMIEKQKEEIKGLDKFDDVFGLWEEEIIERNCTTSKLRRNMIWKETFLF